MTASSTGPRIGICCMLAAALLASSSFAATDALRPGAASHKADHTQSADDGAIAPSEAPSSGGAFVRRVERDGNRVSLQVASRTYRNALDATEVTLVGAVHIGDTSYYGEMQRLLDRHDAVLYESVTPRGAVTLRAMMESDPARATRESMLFLRRMMLKVKEWESKAISGATSNAPPTIARTIERAPQIDSRLGAWVRGASRDAWGTPIEIEEAEDGSFILISRGADRAPGGEGVDADIRLRTPKDRRGSVASIDDGLQGTLAKALGLAFQLEAVNYGDPRWEVADMTEGELSDAFAARGVDGGPLLQSLSGESFTAGAARALLMLIRVADGVTGGAMREAAKLVMIEALSQADDRMMSMGLGEELIQVILHDRNTVAMNALAERRRRGDGVRTIAIFYGAAHMPDLERRLLEEGFTLQRERWFDAMTADPKRAGVDAGMLEQIRAAIREVKQQTTKGAPAE